MSSSDAYMMSLGIRLCWPLYSVPVTVSENDAPQAPLTPRVFVFYGFMLQAGDTTGTTSLRGSVVVVRTTSSFVSRTTRSARIKTSRTVVRVPWSLQLCFETSLPGFDWRARWHLRTEGLSKV